MATCSASSEFSISNTNPPINTPVSFTNSTINGGDYFWDFGDGDTSSEQNPTHVYATPGNYQVKLVATNCHSTDTSAATNVVVMANPIYTTSQDTLMAMVGCGDTAVQSLIIDNSAGGDLVYDLSGVQVLPTPYVFYESFESGLGAFSVSPNANSGYSTLVGQGSGAQGNGFLITNNESGTLSGLVADVPSVKPDNISFYMRKNTYVDRYGCVAISDGSESGAKSLFLAKRING